jgi:hypothetical protein
MKAVLPRYQNIILIRRIAQKPSPQFGAVNFENAKHHTSKMGSFTLRLLF